MTLREIFNSILDYPVEFNFDPWGVVVGVVIAVILLIGMLLCGARYDGDNGWHM